MDILSATVRGTACDHAGAEVLGSGGPATYRQCRACSAILIEQSGRLWRLRPTAG